MPGIRSFGVNCWWVIVVYLLPVQVAVAQSRVSPGLSIEGYLPLGNFETNYRYGVGASAMVAWKAHAQTHVTLAVGYFRLFGESFEDEYLAYQIDDWQALPIRVGGKYFLTPELFLKAESGLVLIVAPGRGTSLIISPGMGLQLGRSQLLGKLETWTNGGTVSFAELSLGYFF